ncbi:hypothetical protein HPP92_015580 [Vanilla planifolia]|uniref:DC1 domain-containing protein n=1 Tax=Vanilla planifolia TaxID=51239 RepID=A0A835QEK5_VANPL|nr:hypothetical protein HPP92_015580 [Vanilla planifolia]
MAISPEGKTVTKEARDLITEHGADAYPFTREQIRKLETEIEEKDKLWPEKIRHESHNHVLWKRRRMFICDGCGKTSKYWSFYCELRCDFDLHPHCALEDGYKVVDSEEENEVEAWPKKIKHKLHKQVLVKAERCYVFDACGVVRDGWSYFCEKCDFDLHPGCVFLNDSMFKEMGNSYEESDDSEEGKEDDDYNKNEELEDDEEEAEDNNKKILGDGSGDKKEGEDTDEDNKNEEDSEGDVNYRRRSNAYTTENVAAGTA